MFLSTAPRSTHEKALYSLTEHLAYNNDDTMDDVGEVWYKKYGLFETDYYEYFPDHLRPTDRAFIFAGTGGSSTLHVDAYNWTGWNGAFVVRLPWSRWPPCCPARRMSRLSAAACCPFAQA